MQSYAITDKGKIRKNNQDYVFCSSSPVGCLENLYVVADGMGGQQAGDFASKYIVDNLVKYIKDISTGEAVSVLKNSIEHVNKALYDISMTDEKYYGMGSTIVAATIYKGILYVANVGDSRLYISEKALTQITKDHSYVEEMVALGKMKRDSQDYQSKKNIITRAVGTQNDVDIDFFEQAVSADSTVLLCSDGLTNMLSDDDIYNIIKLNLGLKEKAEALVAAANKNGGRDNIAVVLVIPQIDEVSLC